MLQRYETEKEYTREIEKMRPKMLEIFKMYTDENLPEETLIRSFEAKIGSKSDCFAHVKTECYHSVIEYRDAWFWGLVRSKDNKLKELIKNPILMEYAILFVERSFLKDSKKYSKLKLQDNDREIYLGNNQNVIGVFIAMEKKPFSENEWRSDPFKGLKMPYTYLTLGQLRKEGYLKGKISADNQYDAVQIRINSLGDVRQFYNNFRNSGSRFEGPFIDCYLDYVESSPDWTKVPILLPEVRWNKKSVHHKYRADYLILNYYTGKRLAIELSPNSTHLIGENVKEEWMRENDKRNSYLFGFNVPTVTFTDEYLDNIQQCFDMVKEVLEMPVKKPLTFEEIISML